MSYRWKNNGIGEDQCTTWIGMDEPIGPAIQEAGINGHMEIDTANNRVRVWRPFNWALGAES